MLDIIREIKDHVLHLAHLVRSSKNVPLVEKIQAKDLEDLATTKLDTMLSASPYGGEVLVREFLTVDAASKVASLVISNLNQASVYFSSLIVDADKEIININTRPDNYNREVRNNFTGLKGKCKCEISTSSNTYAVILGDDGHYHVALVKYWER